MTLKINFQEYTLILTKIKSKQEIQWVLTIKYNFSINNPNNQRKIHTEVAT